MEEEEGAQSCPCGDADESRSHMVGEYEVDKEEQNVLEEGMRKIDGRDTEKCGTFDSSQKTIAILGDKWYHRRPERREIRNRNISCIT